MNSAPCNSDDVHARASDEAPEPLHAFLVETIHSARGPLAVSSMLGLMVSLSAFAIVGAPAFLVHAAAHILIAAGRLHRLMVWDALKRRGLTAREVKNCDRSFMFWSALFASTLGATCWELTAHRETTDAFALSISLCAGFALSFATRSGGRPKTLAVQIAGISGTQVAALLVLPTLHAAVWAALMSGLGAASLVIGRQTRTRLIALFRANEENRRLAEHDILTGLMNRHAMTKAFAQTLATARERPGGRLAVYVIDLDRFKQINDAMGHQAGDAALVETATRLGAAARQVNGAHVARMGGDEFMVVARVQDVEAFGRKMLDDLARPFAYDGAPTTLAASLGAALHPDQGDDAETLMKHADRALYEAKRAGRGRLRVFDAELAARIADEEEIERGLPLAFERDEFEVWYQPIVALDGGGIVGYEGLARWRHPELGLVPPDRFIPIAEQNGAIHRLGEIVLMKACREAASWADARNIAVNLSPRQFRRPEPLVAAVRGALAASGLPPQRLFLEITENFLIEDTARTREAINAISALGVRFSLDDFGRGFSSLAYVQHYPFAKIKIDREFVRDIPADKLSCAIVESVCVLAQRVGMSVIAEGVETQMQRLALQSLGVDLAQGWLFGRPQREPAGQRPATPQAPEIAPLRASG